MALSESAIDISLTKWLLFLLEENIVSVSESNVRSMSISFEPAVATLYSGTVRIRGQWNTFVLVDYFRI